jgi:hypothetical protein
MTMAEADADPAGAPTLEEINGWQGSRLDEIGGASVGRIEGAYVDEPSGEPVWLIVRVGRFGSHTLVPAGDAVGGVGRVWVPYARDLIRGAPKLNAGNALVRDEELELCAHFGIPEGIGRAAQVAGRDAEAATAHPAS